MCRGYCVHLSCTHQRKWHAGAARDEYPPVAIPLRATARGCNTSTTAQSLGIFGRVSLSGSARPVGEEQIQAEMQ